MQATDFQQQLDNIYAQGLADSLYPPDTIRGIVFAVCACPEIPMPEQWLVWVFRQRGQLVSTEQADSVTEILMGMLQGQLAQMREDKVEMPAHYSLDYDQKADSAVELFMQGITIGHRHLESVWQQCWDSAGRQEPERLLKMQRDLKHCLLMFSTFANIELALQQAKSKGNNKLIDNLAKIFEQLPQALKLYVQLAGELAHYLPDQFESFEQPVS